MSNHHSSRQRSQNIVIKTVAAARLVAHLKTSRQPLQKFQGLVNRPHLCPVKQLAILVEHADCHMLAVNLQTDVQHGSLPEVRNRETQTSSTLPDRRRLPT